MKDNETSWGKVADWYGEHLQNDDTYHAKVILPNLLRVLHIKKGEKVLDLACGQGYFAREFAKAGARVTAADISPELIERAKKYPPAGDIIYHVAPAQKLLFAKDKSFDAVVCVLALQNIEDIQSVCKEVKRVLVPGGRFVAVINHPAFRVLRRSSWGFDEAVGVQYRRVEGYLSASKNTIDMHPGKKGSAQTLSYHRSLQDFVKAFASANFAVTKLEEWISHRASGKGPRQKAEDVARKEIPLFMALEAKVLE